MEGKSLTVKNACKMGNAKFQEIVKLSPNPGASLQRWWKFAKGLME